MYAGLARRRYQRVASEIGSTPTSDGQAQHRMQQEDRHQQQEQPHHAQEHDRQHVAHRRAHRGDVDGTARGQVADADPFDHRDRQRERARHEPLPQPGDRAFPEAVAGVLGVPGEQPLRQNTSDDRQREPVHSGRTGAADHVVDDLADQPRHRERRHGRGAVQPQDDGDRAAVEGDERQRRPAHGRAVGDG